MRRTVAVCRRGKKKVHAYSLMIVCIMIRVKVVGMQGTEVMQWIEVCKNMQV